MDTKELMFQNHIKRSPDCKEPLTVDELIECLEDFKKVYGGDRFVEGVSISLTPNELNQFVYNGMNFFNKFDIVRSADIDKRKQITVCLTYEP